MPLDQGSETGPGENFFSAGALQLSVAGYSIRCSLLSAILIFAVTYVALAAGRLPYLRVDRPAAALCGAVAMVVTGQLTLEQAMAAVDLQVLGLLFGVMVIAAYLQEARFFRFTSWWVLTRARSARSLLWGLVFVSGLLSALLVNDTVCIVLTPLCLAVVLEAELPVMPYLLALAAATNVGGVVSFSGNPQNMLIGRAAHPILSFAEYLLLALPIGILALAATAALLSWMFRKELPTGRLPERTTPRPYLNRRLCAYALAALFLFMVLALAGVALGGASLTAAAALMLLSPVPPRERLHGIDWPLLLFFASLLVVVSGLAHSGALEHMFRAVQPAIDNDSLSGQLAFAGATIVGANAVSNVPFVLVALDWVSGLADPRSAYIMLAVMATLAGNLTLFGSVANLIVLEAAGPHGRISFLRFLRYGSVLTAGTVAIAFAVLWLERALGF
jgi:Na+/H+ antiporter NhaD/arsenite permease-like protein